ncbi:MAG TPA: hypothetical protein VHL79_17665 [Ramlibacter sp.]|nr:hypothetical protein [Ramlibacter sp.]
MKKFIRLAAAAGALAVAGAASAQIYGYGQTYGYPAYSTPSQPAVVAGTGYGAYGYGTNNGYYGNNGYNNHNNYPATQNQVYVDQYGRQVTMDQYGRHVYVQPSTSYGVVGYDQWGRPVYGNTTTTTTYGTTYGYSGRGWDRDGDGVANHQDRWPDDRRYR